MRSLLLILFSWFAWLPSKAVAADIAIIIDDVGNTHRDAEVFSLPVEVAVSILPLTGFSTDFSHRAAAQRREVMLHMPMESLAGNKLGPGALTSDMHAQAIHTTLAKALASVPDAIGVNNHMGSKLTQLASPMRATMDFLTQHHLFFVDSRTTRYSKAMGIAQRSGVPVTKRNVFLDHVATETRIDAEFQRLIRLAKKYDYAVGIAHPYPQTMRYLKEALSKVNQLGVQLIPVSEILHLQQVASSAKTNEKPSEALN